MPKLSQVSLATAFKKYSYDIECPRSGKFWKMLYQKWKFSLNVTKKVNKSKKSKKSNEFEEKVKKSNEGQKK